MRIFVEFDIVFIFIGLMEYDVVFIRFIEWLIILLEMVDDVFV